MVREREREPHVGQVTEYTHLLSLEAQLKACGCFVVLMIALGALTGSAITITYSFQGTREKEVQLYQADTHDWNDNEYHLFNNLDIKVSTDDKKSPSFDLNNEEIEQFMVTKHDSYGMNMDDFPDYNPLYYSISELNLTGTLGNGELIERFSENVNRTFVFSIGDNDRVSVVGVPLFQKQVHRHVKSEMQCVRMFGYFNIELKNCETYHQLAKVCVKVNQNDLGVWNLNSTSQPYANSEQSLEQRVREQNGETRVDLQGFGCYGEKNNAVLYERMHLRNSQHINNLFPINSFEMNFVVRNGKDPMLLAKQLSSETFDFGISSQDLRTLGIIGVVISVLLMVRPCIVLCSIKRVPEFSEYGQDQYDASSERVQQRKSQYYQYADVAGDTEEVMPTESDGDLDNLDYSVEMESAQGRELQTRQRNLYLQQQQSSSRGRPIQQVSSSVGHGTNVTVNTSNSSAGMINNGLAFRGSGIRPSELSGSQDESISPRPQLGSFTVSGSEQANNDQRRMMREQKEAVIKQMISQGSLPPRPPAQNAKKAKPASISSKRKRGNVNEVEMTQL